MKPEEPFNIDFDGDLSGWENDHGDTGKNHHSTSDGFGEDDRDLDLPVLKPLNVSFGRKDALKKKEDEDLLSDPGYPVLIPPTVIYPRKASLKRKSAGYRIFVLVAEALSTAAIIIILLTLFRKGPDTINYRTTPQMAVAPTENDGEKQVTEILVPEIQIAEIPENPFSSSAEQTGPVSGDTEMILHPKPADSLNTPSDPSAYETVYSIKHEVYQAKLPASELSAVIPGAVAGVLQAYNGEMAPAQEIPDIRSNVEKFAARFFHERIMKNEGAGEAPVYAVDLAEAGVMGINRLIGTEMVFKKNTNEEGELVSVYFSSRALKVNAPVNRDEPSL